MVKDRIIPVPRHIQLTGDKSIILGKSGEAFCHLETVSLPDDTLVLSAVTLLRSHIQGLLNAEVNGQVPIRLVVEEAPAGIMNTEQAYRLEVTSEAIILTGFGHAGLYYGAVTLVQCLVLEDNLLQLPCMNIMDWPEFKTRGHFMESRYGSNLMTLNDWKYVVDHMASLKMNQLVIGIYGCWCVQYDGRVSEYLYIPITKYPELKTPVVIHYYSPSEGRWINEEKLPPMFEEDFLSELIAYGKSRAVTIFPLFNSLGHNTLIPSMLPEVSAKEEYGQATLTGFCTSNPATYEILFSIYDEIIDRYLIPNGIDSFHVGLDEVCDGIAYNAKDIFKMRSPWCRCKKCRNTDRQTLFINHAIKILNHLKNSGMRNIYLYNDMLTGRDGSITGESCTQMMQALRKNDLTDCVIIDWWTYEAFAKDLTFTSTRPELGLRHTVKPWNGYYHWTVLTNSLPNTLLLTTMGAAENAEGVQSYSAWDESYYRNHAALADCSWNIKGAGTAKEMTFRYVRFHFGPEASRAEHAFHLLDLICGESVNQSVDAPAMSAYHLMLNVLSYYFYSYVKPDKPYPRIFPGEAISILREKPKENLKTLLAIASMAEEARNIFLQIAMNPQCNGKMARRYAYEAGNCRCLTEDYIVLLRMSELTESEESDRFAIIRELASERKLARLSLMSELEHTKEHYLMASHMRNHSIFMQFFSDLKAYITDMGSGNLKLDFNDMRYLESEAFRKLR